MKKPTGYHKDSEHDDNSNTNTHIENENDTTEELNNLINNNNEKVENNEYSNTNNNQTNEKSDNTKENINLTPDHLNNNTSNNNSEHINNDNKEDDNISVENNTEYTTNVNIDAPTKKINDLEKLKEQNKNKLVFETLQKALEAIEKYKGEGNKHFKENSFDEATRKYEDGINSVEEVLQLYEGYNSTLDIKNIEEIIETIKTQRVLIISNLSNSFLKQGKYQESFNLDMNIISQYNPNWDKSYSRMIICCMKRNDIMLANQYAAIFKMRFSASTIEKYAQTFKDLEEETVSYQERMKQEMATNKSSNVNITNVDNNNVTNNNSSLKSSKLENEVEAKTVNKKPSGRVARRRLNYGLFFGGLVFIGSAIGLFFLFANKKRYFK